MLVGERQWDSTKKDLFSKAACPPVDHPGKWVVKVTSAPALRFIVVQEIHFDLVVLRFVIWLAVWYLMRANIS